MTFESNKIGLILGSFESIISSPMRYFGSFVTMFSLCYVSLLTVGKTKDTKEEERTEISGESFLFSPDQVQALEREKKRGRQLRSGPNSSPYFRFFTPNNCIEAPWSPI